MSDQIVTSILGENACNDLKQGKTISVLLNNNSVEELAPYLHLTPNGNQVQLGAGNITGAVEDIKRPYGMGIGFGAKKK